MAQAVAGSKQLQTLVDEMRIISQKQYFANDTLSGRAAEVYRDLRQSLRAAASSASISASSSIATPASSSALVSSLGKSTHSRGGHFADLSTHEVVGIGVEGLEEAMNELQLEEHLAQARRAQEEKEQKAACAMAEDEDEPTNCGGALEPRPSVFSDDSDRGVCLSMWQPWASLLVLGIKRFEGRGWYTPYRGRLWIASGSRETTPEEIQQVEDEYRAVYGPNAKIPFPADYPTSALLGCVDLTHCWSAEEFQAYRSNHGAGGEDSASAFVFVCSNPRTLPLPQSHSGQHKLYNLPPKLYQSIGPNLKPVSEQWRLQLTSQKEAETAGFDIWPATIRPAGASSSAALQAVKPTIQVLQPGMLLLKSALSLPVQQAIVDCIRHIGLLGSCTGFTTPQYKDGPQMNLKMLCLGMYWDLNTKKWQQRNAQGKTQYPIPATLLEEVDKMLTIAVDYLQSRGAGSKFPHYKPDLAIVNYYSASSGKLGVHQDKDESRESITAGYPVVSFSIGDSCDFVYGNQRIPDEKLNLPGGQAYSKVTLASGDVLLFGGPSRSIFHGVESIKGGTAPRGLFFKQGRLNITFRKM
jgi:alkylated DNA repair dioxygenase AlkB